MKKTHLTILSLGLCLGMAAVACSNSDDGGGEGGSGGDSDSGGKGGGGKGGSKSGGAGGSSNSGPGKQVPDGDDEAAWKTFLEDGEYKKGGWVAETAMPRSGKAPTVHGRVRVYFNQKMKAAHASYPASYEKGSAVVKEFFDADDKSVGWATLLKIGEGEDEYADWQVYCSGPEKRCAKGNSEDQEVSFAGGLGDHSECSSCHHKGAKATQGKLIYTKAPQQ